VGRLCGGGRRRAAIRVAAVGLHFIAATVVGAPVVAAAIPFVLFEQVVLQLGHGGAGERGQVVAVEENLVLVSEMCAQKVLVAELLLA